MKVPSLNIESWFAQYQRFQKRSSNQRIKQCSYGPAALHSTSSVSIVPNVSQYRNGDSITQHSIIFQNIWCCVRPRGLFSRPEQKALSAVVVVQCHDDSCKVPSFKFLRIDLYIITLPWWWHIPVLSLKNRGVRICISLFAINICSNFSAKMIMTVVHEP